MTAQLDTTACPTPLWLPGPHSQTLYSALATPTHSLRFVRERVDTPDGDFIDLDWNAPGMVIKPERHAPDTQVLPRDAMADRWLNAHDADILKSTQNTHALVLLHGLEGSSGSRYAQSIMQYFRARGWVVVMAHFRGCSGVANRLARAYYSGDSEEVGFILKTVQQHVPHALWHAVGVSLGGNALLKYLGEHAADINPAFQSAAAIAAPIDLLAAGEELSNNFFCRKVYTRFFLKSLKPKVIEKAKRFPGTIDVMRMHRARTLRDFDDAYTAPMHGFQDASDYWRKASSKPWLSHIKLPTLVLNARNDPFIPEASLPSPSDGSDAVLLHQPAEGGHAGFTTGTFPGNLLWLPQRLARFFDRGE